MSRHKGFFAGSAVTETRRTRMLPQCGSCGLCGQCQSPKMPVTGDGSRRVLFVAEAPGEQEDKEGVQLIGKAGQRLRRVLDSLGFDLDTDGWKTNALICRPPKNRKPTSAEIGFCRPNLLQTIRELKPRVIVLLGAAAVDSLIGYLWNEDLGNVGRWVGWKIPCQKPNVWICPTWHPSFLEREQDPVLDRQFKKHLSRALEPESRPWSHGGAPDWAKDVQHILDPHQAAAWLQNIARLQHGAVAFDYETNMLKPDSIDSRIISCAVAWGRTESEHCIAFPWQGKAIEAMKELVRCPLQKIASNLKFEERWTRKVLGVRVRNWAWDTMLAAHVADNRQGITSVKFQAFVRLGQPLWNNKIEQFLKTKGDEKVNSIIQEIELSDLLTYNGLDALLEFRVAVDQMNELGFPIPWEV